eukprot:5046329-Amphidinium_carterae.1
MSSPEFGVPGGNGGRDPLQDGESAHPAAGPPYTILQNVIDKIDKINKTRVLLILSGAEHHHNINIIDIDWQGVPHP